MLGQMDLEAAVGWLSHHCLARQADPADDGADGVRNACVIRHNGVGA